MGPRTLRWPRGGQVWRLPTSRLLGLDRAGRRWTRSWLLETETALLVVKAEMALVGVMAEVKAEMHLAVVMVVRLGLRCHATIDLAHALVVVQAEMALVSVMAEVKAETHLAVVMVVRLGLRGYATIDLAHAAAQRRWTRRSWQS